MNYNYYLIKIKEIVEEVPFWCQNTAELTSIGGVQNIKCL
jgi:hypothetical protein